MGNLKDLQKDEYIVGLPDASFDKDIENWEGYKHFSCVLSQ
jgi:hypothetical protein